MEPDVQPHSGCVLKVGVTAPAKEPPFQISWIRPCKCHHIYNDIHLSINPLYLNVAVLFISECLQHCFILENLFQYLIVSFFWLDMSVCNLLDCNEDIFDIILN